MATNTLAAGLIVLVLGLVAAGAGAAAQTVPETKKEKAREFFRAALSENIKRDMYYQAQIVLTMGLAQMHPEVRGEDALRILKEELDKAFDQNLPTLADQVVANFVEGFTEDELDALWSAEESPARQSMMAKMPAVAEKTGAVINAWREPIVLAVLRAVDQRLPEMRKVQQPEEEVPLE